MGRLILYEFKKIYYRHTTWIMLLISTIIALLALLIQFTKLPWIPEKNSIAAAFEASLIWRNPLTFMVLVIITPLSASIIHSDTYFNEYSNKLAYVMITKVGRYNYYIGKVIVVIITSFIVSILPFFLNQLLCIISFPSQTLMTFNGWGIYENSYQYLLDKIKYKNLFFSNPLIYNYLHILFVGVYGVVMGVLSYTFSLYYTKQWGYIIIFPTLLTFGLLLIASATGMNDMILVNYLVSYPIIKNIDVNILYIFFILSILLCFAAIFYKAYSKKDVL